MSLPLVNPFAATYEAWSYRKLSFEEALQLRNGETHVRDKLLATVNSGLDAAAFMAWIGAHSGLESFIDRSLATDPAFAAWRQMMPSRTPPELTRYQKHYPKCNFAKVDEEIRANGVELSQDQILFHAGLWPDSSLNQFVTDRPLSTTFCPQVALRNAEHNAKAYDANRIDLFVLRVQQPKTKVFSYRTRGTSFHHEKEVLFGAGSTLTLRNRILISNDYPAGKWGFPHKVIQTYVLEVDIS